MGLQFSSISKDFTGVILMNKLLFDSSTFPFASHKLKKDRILKFLFSQIIVAFIFALVTLVIERGIGYYYPGIGSYYDENLLISLYYIMPSEIFFILYSFSFGHVKLYNDGISVPKKGILRLILGKENFIPYEQIKYGEKQEGGVMLFVSDGNKKEKKYFVADYYYEVDQEKFMKILEKKIKIRKNE